jgi:Domain of unknown function (DUF4388)
VALSGNLGFVPLDEVLRLLMRSDQRGAVEIRGEDIRGRIFVGKRGIGLATTSEDRDLHAHLVNSGYVDDEFLRGVASGKANFSDLGDRANVVVDLLREITVESIYHLSKRGASFDVAEGATSVYSASKPFELEQILDDAHKRADEWADVHRAIADLDATIRMNRDAGDQDEIRINREAWRLLCELGSGASVKVMADRLGTTEFWIARVAADMAQQDLVYLAEATPETTPSSLEAPAGRVSETTLDENVNPNQSWWTEPQEEAGEATTEVPIAESDFSEADSDESFSSDPISEAPAAEVKESRFGQFLTGARGDTAPAPIEVAESIQDDYQAPADEFPDSGSDDSTPDDGIEADTEAFLEKVFSQLDVNDEVEEEGHGLLRRRRMGSVLKEIDED